MKKIIAIVLSVIMAFSAVCINSNAVIESDALSLVLMEASSGRVFYEKNSETPYPPASVTKIMTMLLVMEAVESGRIALTDMVSVSENAASMGGSQVYLEVGEQMSVDEMLKCVAVASANDAAVALAEFVAGSEGEFVKEMNKRAEQLGMKNTNFENTNGLDDTAQNHVTSAMDIAIMSKQLLLYPKITDYTKIWMDSVRNGEFGITNTNRLIRFYPGANGLKTGSTSKAGFCISATAERDGMQLIAVVMGAKTRDSRNKAAAALLDYGFANYSRVFYPGRDCNDIKIIGGINDTAGTFAKEFSLIVEKSKANSIKIEGEIPDFINAPAEKGSVVGKIKYSFEGDVIAESDVILSESVERIGFLEQLKKILAKFLFY